MTNSINSYKLNLDKLLKYGFIKKDNYYELEKDISPKFIAYFQINFNTFKVNVIDKTTEEEYIPYKLKTTTGNYVANLRQKVEELKIDILNNCYDYDNISSKILSYVKDKYQTTPEYPWAETPSAYTLKTNNKWYGLYMKIPFKSLKIAQEGEVEIINLKNNPEKIKNIIDNKVYYPAYHMNKKHWLTIILSNKTNLKEVYELIDESYNLVKKEPKMKEKSCGAVVFNKDKVLVVKHQKGHTDFPKGHVEQNETEEKTAIREVKEETNIDITIIPTYREVISYTMSNNNYKEVVFFLALAKTEEIIIDEEEIAEASWVKIDEVKDLLTYDLAKELYLKMLEYYKFVI